MFDFLKNLFDKRKYGARKRDQARYEQEKRLSQSEDAAGRLTLARSSETHQEILYYLAEHDPDPKVRRAVALNSATPLQAARLLAKDSDVDVRLALADRLVRLLPDLGQGRQSQLYAFAVQALATLALDEVLKIRKALASTLKDYALAPPKVVGQLARDIEREVSEPILRFCAAVSDEDLIEILKDHPASWVVQAIAGREQVSGPVSSAVIKTDDREGGQILIENKGAAINENLLKTIIDKARLYPEWQKPIAVHKTLSPDMARTLAAFADASVRDVLAKREDFDQVTVESIVRVFQRRLEYLEYEEQSGETPMQRARKLDKDGRLTEAVVTDALGLRDYDFVTAAIACLAGVEISNVKKVMAMRAPKPIIALTWKAGLSMRLALRLQQEMGKVPNKDLLYPRGGTDYPLTEDEIRWQLEFLGLEAA